MERELPLGVGGLIEKHLSWDAYQGESSKIRILAGKISLLREEFGFPGDNISDWLEAKQVIRQEFTEEELEKRGLSLRRELASDIMSPLQYGGFD